MGRLQCMKCCCPRTALLVSQTDTGGRITFANDAFVRVSGFSREELLGAPHNLVRHPHMPQAAFRDLWATAKSGRPWEGLVKNRTKNGDFYWVRANVTPVVEGGELKGFISIRGRPERHEVAAAEAIYASMREGRSRGLQVRGGAIVRTGLAARWQRVTSGIASSFAVNLGIFFTATVASLMAGALGIGVEVRAPMLLGVAVTIVIATMLLMRRMRQAFLHIEGQFAALARGDLRQKIDAARVHELRVISEFLRSLRAKFAYAEEARAQRERDSAMARVAALREVAIKVENVANQTGEDVTATTISIAANAVEMVEAAAAVRTQGGYRVACSLRFAFQCSDSIRGHRGIGGLDTGDRQPDQRCQRVHSWGSGRKQRGGADDLPTADRGGPHRTDHLADRGYREPDKPARIERHD